LGKKENEGEKKAKNYQFLVNSTPEKKLYTCSILRDRRGKNGRKTVKTLVGMQKGGKKRGEKQAQSNPTGETHREPLCHGKENTFLLRLQKEREKVKGK